MPKYFYSHIVETTEISIAIGGMDMPNDDRVKLISLAQENLHHTILDKVLSKLSKEDKKAFLSHVHSEKHGHAWDFLKGRIEDLEDLVIKAAQELKKEMHKDIEDAKK